MPDSFFTSSKPRKRKRTSDAGPSTSRKAARKGAPQSNGRVNDGKKKRDEELDSENTDNEAANIDDMDLRAPSDYEAMDDEEDPDETPAEKRLRLAQLYLEKVKDGLKLADGEFDAAEIDRELISARLKQDVLEHSGKVHLFVADSFDLSEPPKTTLRTKTAKSCVTAAVASDVGSVLFTSSKDGSISKWDLVTGKKIIVFHAQRKAKVKGKNKGKGKALDPSVEGHTDEVLALAISSDGRYLASGGKDKRLIMWDAEKGEWIKAFFGPLCHKDSVSTLAFRKNTHQLYSGSLDRTVKVFDMSPAVMGYVETLYGHQDNIVALDALRGETCVSVGARDKTVRYWKITDETQLVFRGGGKSRVREVLEGGLADDEEETEKKKETVTQKFVEGSLECVAMIDESTFLSGGDSGSICLWTTQKKKSIYTQALCHGLHTVHSETEGVIKTPRWITALGTLRYSDVFASGSWDGEIRLWKLDAKLKSFSLLGSISAPGVINSLQFISTPKDFYSKAAWATAEGEDGSSKDGVLLVAGVGREHRLGRWVSVEAGWNRAVVVAIPRRS